jgi:hypothetical protein
VVFGCIAGFVINIFVRCDQLFISVEEILKYRYNLVDGAKPARLASAFKSLAGKLQRLEYLKIINNDLPIGSGKPVGAHPGRYISRRLLATLYRKLIVRLGAPPMVVNVQAYGGAQLHGTLEGAFEAVPARNNWLDRHLNLLLKLYRLVLVSLALVILK